MARDTALVADGRIALVDRSPDDGPAAHGLDAFRAAASAELDVETVAHWTAADTPLVVGTTGDRAVRRLAGDAVDPDRAEGVVRGYRDTGDGEALLVAGTDEVGLMYALLDLARRVEVDGAGALADVEEAVTYPDNEVRGVDRFLSNPDEDRWFYDDDFWEAYLDRLARNRFNRFVLLTGYDTAFMSPPYPFFVDVPGYGDVSVGEGVDATPAQHLAQLRDVGQKCHERGIEFVFGTWQQRPRSANPHLGDTGQEFLVEGVPDDDAAFTEFCARGLEELLVACPEIDALQLRVNMESGVGDRTTAESFWRDLIDAVARAGDRRGDDVELDPRAKGCTDRMLRWATEAGLDVTVPTKFWCESTGLPYHQTRMRAGELANLDDLNRRRRYGYADLLERPRVYDVLYRLWVYGTNRLFVWGDPDYARRFGHAAGFGDGRGFEVTAPLSMKGGRHFLRDPWPLFADESLRHYEYEDDRYWAWYVAFGRFGYDAGADADVWDREFRARFGDGAGAVAAAYRHASTVLPLVTAAHLTVHPANANWAEMDTGGALFAAHNVNDTFGDTTYASAEPSDPGLFYGVEEYVDDRRGGDLDRRYTPLQVARWYDHLADATRAALADADEEIDAGDHPEYRATRSDLLCVADLATYHASKTRAAVAATLADRGEDDLYAVARDHLGDARAAWASLADRAEGVYGTDVLFGRDPATASRGTWSDALDELDADRDELAARAPSDPDPDPDPDLDPGRGGRHGPDDPAGTGHSPLGAGVAPAVDVSVPDGVAPGDPVPVTVRADGLGLADLDGVRLHYRRADQTEGDFESVAMTPAGDGYRATVPGEYVTPGLDLLVYVTAVDGAGDVVVHPGPFHPGEPAPYYVVAVEDAAGARR